MVIRTCSLGLVDAFLLSFGIAVFPAFCAEDVLENVQQTPAAESGIASPSRDSRLTWDSPRLQKARKEWDETIARFRLELPSQNRNNFEKHGKELDTLFAKHFSTEDMQDLADDLVNIPAAEDAGGSFVSYLVSNMMIVRLVAEGDRERLVLLLAVRCPRRVQVGYDVAGYLAIKGEKLTDPILILGEAYVQSKAPENRAQIATTVRRGFADWSIPGKDDDEFVRNAMQWYREHKEEIVANEQYVKTTMINAIPYLKFPLFIKRDSKPDGGAIRRKATGKGLAQGMK